jgi:hypothetical protein
MPKLNSRPRAAALGALCSRPAELMADPLIGLVMRSDGVDRRDLELLPERVARERAAAIARPEVLTHGPSDC